MTFNAMTEHYEEITVCGKPALFTSIRMKSHLCFPSVYERREKLWLISRRIFLH